MSAKTKGRPKGASNIERPVVVLIPPACPRDQGGCGATDYEVLRIASAQEIPGVLPCGHAYDRVVWRRVRCRACGKHFAIRSYEADPEPEADGK